MSASQREREKKRTRRGVATDVGSTILTKAACPCSRAAQAGPPCAEWSRQPAGGTCRASEGRNYAALGASSPPLELLLLLQLFLPRHLPLVLLPRPAHASSARGQHTERCCIQSVAFTVLRSKGCSQVAEFNGAARFGSQQATRWRVATQRPRPCRQKPCWSLSWHTPRTCSATQPPTRSTTLTERPVTAPPRPPAAAQNARGTSPAAAPAPRHLRHPHPRPPPACSRCGWVEVMSGGGRGGGWREVAAAANAPAARWMECPAGGTAVNSPLCSWPPLHGPRTALSPPPPTPYTHPANPPCCAGRQHALLGRLGLLDVFQLVFQAQWHLQDAGHPGGRQLCVHLARLQRLHRPTWWASG